MDETSTKPENFKAWLKQAMEEETFAFLFERIDQLQKGNAALEKEVQALQEQVKNLNMAMATHKHTRETGEASIPAGVVIPLG